MVISGTTTSGALVQPLSVFVSDEELTLKADGSILVVIAQTQAEVR